MIGKPPRTRCRDISVTEPDLKIMIFNFAAP